jgi:hypothetical protein
MPAQRLNALRATPGAKNDRVQIRWQSNLELRQDNKIAKCLLCVAVKTSSEFVPTRAQQAGPYLGSWAAPSGERIALG